jgi:chromosome partitioning protein
MKVITSINEKGGVGKSLMAITAACGLAARGKKVLLIDTDEQGHVSTALGYQKAPGLFNLLEMNADWKDVLWTVQPERFMPPGAALHQAGRLLILPSDVRTRALPFTMRPDAMHLYKRLRQVENVFDYVLIDTAPSASLLHILIYTATDYVLYPTKTEYLSFDGLVEAMNHLESANDQRAGRHLPPVEIIGIVPNMYRKGTLEHDNNLAALRDSYGDMVWEPIGERTMWAESLSPVSNYCPVYAYAPGSKAANEAWGLVNQIQTITGVSNEQSA